MLVAMTKPVVVLVIGIPGAGKTTLIDRVCALAHHPLEPVARRPANGTLATEGWSHIQVLDRAQAAEVEEIDELTRPRASVRSSRSGAR